MKKFIYIFALCLVGSCSNNFENKVANSESDATSEMMLDITITKEQAHTLLLSQKIQERIAITQLNDKHPEFISETASDNIFNFQIDAETQLDTIRILETEVKGDTSLLNLHLRYKNKSGSYLDTLHAQIITKEMMLAGENIITNEVIFENLNP